MVWLGSSRRVLYNDIQYVGVWTRKTAPKKERELDSLSTASLSKAVLSTRPFYRQPVYRQTVLSTPSLIMIFLYKFIKFTRDFDLIRPNLT
jgi:hypothetical protein